jgi:hypothetical protein
LAFSNAIVSGLLLLNVVFVWLALAALAPEVNPGPLPYLLVGCIVLSICGIVQLRKVPGRAKKVGGFSLHAFGLLLSFALVFSFLSISSKTVPEKYLIPDGYKGDIYVIFNVPTGRPVEKDGKTLIYRIPQDGVLLTSAKESPQLFSASYFFQREDGSLQPIVNEWLTTLESSPENLKNDSDWGIYFPRAGATFMTTRVNGEKGCSVHYDQFYVGTKSHLLTKYRERDLTEYLRQHPEACASSSQ